MRLKYAAALAVVIPLLGFGTCGDDPVDDDDATTRVTDATPEPTPRAKDGPADAYLEALPEAHRGHIAALGDPATAARAREALVELGEAALGSLQDAALLSSDPAVQGWAIEVMGRIPGERSEQTLELIQGRTNTSELVRTWAAAARIRRATDLAGLAKLAALANAMPALQRPLGLRATALVDADSTVADLISLSNATPALQQALAEPILARGADALLSTMFTHPDNNTRRTAAAYLGTLGSRDASVAKTVADAYAWSKKHDGVFWAGGALYVPNLQWKQAEARILVGHLVEWHLVCDRLGQSGEKQQVYNNLRSVQLHRPAGMPWPSNDTDELLKQWAGVAGQAAVDAMLARHPGNKATR